jgi:hypothetical protein
MLEQMPEQRSMLELVLDASPVPMSEGVPHLTIISSSLAALLHATADMAEAGLLPDPPHSECQRLTAARAEQAGWRHWPRDRIIPHDVEASNWPERWREASGL